MELFISEEWKLKGQKAKEHIDQSAHHASQAATIVVEAYTVLSPLRQFKSWLKVHSIPEPTAYRWIDDKLYPEKAEARRMADKERKKRLSETANSESQRVSTYSDSQPETIYEPEAPAVLRAFGAPTLTRADTPDDIDSLIDRIRALIPSLTEDEACSAYNDLEVLMSEVASLLP